MNVESSCHYHCCLICNCSPLGMKSLIFRVVLASGCILNGRNGPERRTRLIYYSSFLLPSWQGEHTDVSCFGLRRAALEFKDYSTGSFIHILAQ